jgi:hypothetical protein
MQNADSFAGCTVSNVTVNMQETATTTDRMHNSVAVLIDRGTDGNVPQFLNTHKV